MRVLLDMKVAAPRSRFTLDEAISEVVKTLALEMSWERLGTKEFDALVNDLAAQLPPDDLVQFVANATVGMKKHQPRSWLVVGGYSDPAVPSIIHVRIRMMATNNAVLVPLGKEVADVLLEQLDHYELVLLTLWEDRQMDPLLPGVQVVESPVGFLDAARLNPQLTIVLAVAIVVLIGGLLYSLISFGKPWEMYLFSDPLWVWYARLVAPLLMAVVTTVAGLYSETRGSVRRTAEWDIEG